MSLRRGRRVTRQRLRWTLGLLLLALAVPSVVLVVQTQRQLKWEAFHQSRQLAMELAERIDARLRQLIATEDARAYVDYQFLTVAGGNLAADPGQMAVLQRSPLAQFPVRSELPGLLGWFQIDAAGGFASPLLPAGSTNPTELARLGLSADEIGARRALQEQLLDVLGRNALVVRRRPSEALAVAAPAAAGGTYPAELDDPNAGALAATREAVSRASASPLPPPAPASSAGKEKPDAAANQVAFDQLKRQSNAPQQKDARALGNVADLRLDTPFAERGGARDERIQELQAKLEPQRGRRLEQAAAPASDGLGSTDAESNAGPATPLRMFDSELDPFEMAALGSGHFVLFRRVWRDGQRSIQGALIDQREFLRGALAEPFGSSLLAPIGDLRVAWQGSVLERIDGRGSRGYLRLDDALTGTLLHRARLSAPLADMELIWTIRQLPASPGASLVAWAGLVLFAVLLAGFFALYRLGLRQLALADQQQDFIAAVSHELKTPLTSIRMYGELLRAGWASEDKKREYYDYIHDESERLSRLIANVLQLARLERDELQLDLKTMAVTTLFDLIRSKVQAQIERAGFEVEFALDPECSGVELKVDPDALVQVLINLVDNALKFSARAPRRRIEITAAAQANRRIAFAVRDYGPGVPVALRRKVFELFFRAGNELTRETHGTGIGLALVRQLASGMGGEIELLAREPGVEFRLLLPLQDARVLRS